MKELTNKYFKDWENHVFGFGYGTGEKHTLQALKDFINALNDGRSYDYEELEKKLGGQVAWLMINILGHADIIEYGTSPRHGWLTYGKGDLLPAFLKDKSVDDLYDICFAEDEHDSHAYCTPSYCNCGTEQIEKMCDNPLYQR